MGMRSVSQGTVGWNWQYVGLQVASQLYYSMCGTNSTEQKCLSRNTYAKHVLWKHSLTVVHQQHCVKQYTVQCINTKWAFQCWANRRHVNLYFSQPKYSLYQMVTNTAKLTESDVLKKKKKIIQFIQLLSLEQLKPCVLQMLCGIKGLMLLHKTTIPTFK